MFKITAHEQINYATLAHVAAGAGHGSVVDFAPGTGCVSITVRTEDALGFVCREIPGPYTVESLHRSVDATLVG